MTKLVIKLEKKEDCVFALRAISERWGELSPAVVSYGEETGKMLPEPKVARSRKATEHRPWKDKELMFLRKNMDVMSLNDLAKKLDRTRAAVSVKKHWMTKKEASRAEE